MKRALVIEDSMLIAMMIRDHLITVGYGPVDIATTRAEAICTAELRCPDLITVEDRLDDGSGVDAIREICKDQAIPVVFIVSESAHVIAEMPDAFVLLKPFSVASLAAAICAAEAAEPLSIASPGVTIRTKAQSNGITMDESH